MDNNFILRKTNGAEPASLKFSSAAVRGFAVGYGADADTAIAAEGTNFVGFISRDVTTNGPTLSEIVIPTQNLELPFKAGEEVGILTNAQEVEVEGGEYIKEASTGAISNATAVGTALSFDAGKFYVAQSGEVVYFTLAAQLTPLNGGAARILVVKA